MRNAFKWAALAAVPFAFCSCGLLDAAQVTAALQAIAQMEADGVVTPEQAEALRQALESNTGEPWYLQVGRVVGEVALALIGVRLWRGPAATITERLARAAAIKKK
tara:strand:- start:13653 stop:13970 length:318 start_codon:yes stop_codon:yes gene_type:complete